MSVTETVRGFSRALECGIDERLLVRLELLPLAVIADEDWSVTVTGMGAGVI